ncbi:glycosyltransferase family 4 protein [Flexibacterium corallicola]|uniref:glycosyltransferase family 4 protein n=1 Tax=Flexibacterium corallicola TaxID=3037259 RepID=UPI00286F613D|nr:glycosyltransferase family 4 protein [Pseudovibrio sp. M1P-2-3]
MQTVGYVLEEFPVLSETFVGNEIRAMQSLGHKVVPLILKRASGPAQPEDIKLSQEGAHFIGEAGVRTALPSLKCLSLKSSEAINFVNTQMYLPKFSLLGNSFKIASFASTEKVDHFHAHFSGPASAHAIAAARLSRKTVSFVCHGHDVYEEAYDLPLKLASADFVVSVCNDLSNDLHDIQPAAKVSMIPCGTDPRKFQSVSTSQCNGRLLFIGRLVEQKGVDDILQAFSEMDKFPPIDIVGDGPLRKFLEEKAAVLDPRENTIKFLGVRDSHWLAGNAPNYMALIAPFKKATNGARDTGPLVVKEAMSMELPVITTAFMGMKETVTPETGFLVTPGNPTSLRQGIEDLLKLSKEERKALGRAGRKRVLAHFTLEKSGLKLSSAIQMCQRENTGNL